MWAWLAEPGPALRDVVVDRNALVMPPKIEMSQAFGAALYSMKAVLAGRSGDAVDFAKAALQE